MAQTKLDKNAMPFWDFWTMIHGALACRTGLANVATRFGAVRAAYEAGVTVQQFVHDVDEVEIENTPAADGRTKMQGQIAPHKLLRDMEKEKTDLALECMAQARTIENLTALVHALAETNKDTNTARLVEVLKANAGARTALLAAADLNGIEHPAPTKKLVSDLVGANARAHTLLQEAADPYPPTLRPVPDAPGGNGKDGDGYAWDVVGGVLRQRTTVTT